MEAVGKLRFCVELRPESLGQSRSRWEFWPVGAVSAVSDSNDGLARVLMDL